MEFVVVEFCKEKSSCAIPSTWLLEDGLHAKWPDIKNYVKLKKALRGQYNFDEGVWILVAIRVLGRFSSYKEAKLKEKLYDYTSHIDTEDETGSKRKRKKKVFDSFESEYEESVLSTTQRIHGLPDFPSRENSPVKIQNRHLASQSHKLPYFPSQEKSPSIRRRNINLATQSHNATEPHTDFPSQVPVTPISVLEKSSITNETSISPNITFLGKSPQRENAAEEMLKDLKSFFIKCFEDMKIEIKRNRKSIKDLRDLIERQNLDLQTMPEDIALFFPILSELQLQEVELKAQDTDLSRKMVQMLSKIGGENYKDVTFNVMSKAISPSVAKLYSFHGKKGKLAFKNLALCKIITSAIQKCLPEEQLVNIERRIGTFLSQAPDKDGGRKERSKNKMLELNQECAFQKSVPEQQLNFEERETSLSSTPPNSQRSKSLQELYPEFIHTIDNMKAESD